MNGLFFLVALIVLGYALEELFQELEIPLALAVIIPVGILLFAMFVEGVIEGVSHRHCKRSKPED